MILHPRQESPGQENQNGEGATGKIDCRSLFRCGILFRYRS